MIQASKIRDRAAPFGGLRAVVTGVVALALAFSVCVFDAVFAADRATTLGRAALYSPATRADMLARAQDVLAGSWSRGPKWHAGAAEAEAWTSSLAAAHEGAPAVGRAVAAGERAVGLSPVAPITWMRLGALAGAGAANAVCGVQECLARSWRAAAVIEPEPGCARLQMSVAAGLMPDDDDPRFADYVATVRDHNNAKACFAHLPPQRSFRLLLRFE